MSGVQLTERDLELLSFINLIGFCEMPQIDQRFHLRKPRNYQLINRLIEGGYVRHERIFHGRPGIYRLTPKGARLTDLPALGRVSLANYTHDLTLLQVYLRLRELYPQATWVSERALRSEKYFTGVGKSGHLSDGLLLLPEQKPIAIEVELSLKGRARFERILKGYSALFEVGAVWYYCSPSIVSSVRAMTARMPFVHVYHLGEFLHGQLEGGFCRYASA